MSADPYIASGGVSAPSSWNRYAYVLGDPINGNDPRGLCGVVLSGQDGLPHCSDGTLWYDFLAQAEMEYYNRVSQTFAEPAAESFSITTTIDYGDGQTQSFVNEGTFAAPFTNILGAVHTGLDVLGLVPGIGEIADGLNAGIYAIEGDATNAGLSLASMIPVGGSAASITRLAREIVEHFPVRLRPGSADIALSTRDGSQVLHFDLTRPGYMPPHANFVEFEPDRLRPGRNREIRNEHIFFKR